MVFRFLDPVPACEYKRDRFTVNSHLLPSLQVLRPGKIGSQPSVIRFLHKDFLKNFQADFRTPLHPLAQTQFYSGKTFFPSQKPANVFRVSVSSSYPTAFTR